MHARIVSHPHIWNIYAGDNWDSTHSAAFSKAAINDLTRKIIDTSAGSNYFGPAIQYGIKPPTFAGLVRERRLHRCPRRDDESGVDRALDHVRGPGARHRGSATDNNTIYVIYLPENGGHQQRAVRWDVRQLHRLPPAVDGAHRGRPDFTIPPFDAHFQSYPYAVIPLKCAKVMRDPANHGTVTSRGAPGDPLDADD